MLATFFEDLRYAVRGLRRSPLLTFAATVTLAASIGASTTVFSIANSILIRPLPYPGPGRIDWISERTGPDREDVATAPDYYAIRERNRIFEDVAECTPVTVNWTGVERPEQLDAADVSASFFRVMGTRPMRGRYFAPDEEGPKAPPVAVVSYSFWRNRLGSDPRISSRTIALDRLPRTIIGVMPQGFDFPRGTEIWLPSGLDQSTESFPVSPTRPIRTVSIVARRKPEMTPPQTASEMSRLTASIRAEYKVFQATGFRADVTVAATPLQEHQTGSLRPALLVLMGAVGLVLMIACVNLANLLLARASGRQREFAVRLALGSSRGRIVRQMLAESLAVALPGGIAGAALASIAVWVVNITQPAILERYPTISMDLRALAFTAALTLGTSLLFGMAPALAAAGIQIQESLKSSSLSHSGSRGAVRLRKMLVVAELGISLVLLIGAGLLARSLIHLAHTELGFRADHLLTFRVNPIGPFDRNYIRFYADVLGRLEQLPMAKSAALLAEMPLDGERFFNTGRVRVVGHAMVRFAERPQINNTLVSPDFFRTLEIPVRNGRVFDAHDFAPRPNLAPGVPGLAQTEPVVVNEAFVRQMLPGENPLGQRLGFGPDARNITWTIIGVVGDIRGGTLGADPASTVYRCTCSGSSVFRAAFAIRTAGDPKAAIRAAEQQVREVDRDQPIFDVKTMEQRRELALGPERFELILIGAFAGIGVLLAAAGIYGVMSYLISRRTREIGIRMAMGARPADVLIMVLGETGMLVALAVAVGLGGAWAVTRYIRSSLYGVSELDTATFGLAPVLMVVIVLAACIGPAFRAVRVDPISALREE